MLDLDVALELVGAAGDADSADAAVERIPHGVGDGGDGIH